MKRPFESWFGLKFELVWMFDLTNRVNKSFAKFQSIAQIQQFFYFESQ